MSNEGREVSAEWLFDNFGKWLPMSRCVELAESHHAALAAAGIVLIDISNVPSECRVVERPWPDSPTSERVTIICQSGAQP